MAKEQTVNISMLESKGIDELIALATELGLDNGSGLYGLRREELISLILHNYSDKQNLVGQGTLETMNDGYGFLRQNGLRSGNSDIYVSQSQIRRFGLRTGDYVTGQVRPPKNFEKYYWLLRVESSNDMEP